MTCRQSLAIATGPGRPDTLFGSLDALAQELRRRATSPAHLWARPARLASPHHPAEVLAVHDDEDGWPIGYVVGLGHDRDALDAAIARAATVETPS